MIAASSTKERRNSERLKGRKEAILITPNGMHNIRDISKSGLSFKCSEEDFFPSQWPVEIIYAGTPLYIKAIKVRMVRENFVETDTLIANSSKEIGVEFVDMDESGKLLLHELLAYHSKVAEKEHPNTH
ncbi:PilZ domain-containing protein [Desulfosediminicola flagellatus]|uniref:PilZ domain-containing protein n=1 Tax=Desulfosediminicola flagellatus TaxID=2569541 RepID=UPI0010AD298F|nr:PilZ domain-containing protein [Desulfosediminicola flagellatus]